MTRKSRRTRQTPAQRREMAHAANEKLVLIRGALVKSRDEAIGAQDFESAAQINNALMCVSGVRVRGYRSTPRLDRGPR